MSKVFLSHSSVDKESYINVVANRLVKAIGEECVILDEITFQEGRKTIKEVEGYLEITDLFVFFISETSLESEWVRIELFKAKELWDSSKLNQICPIIIDKNIKYDDKRIPDWMRENYNIQYIERQSKSASLILERMIEISYERHPRLKAKNEIFVGRNKFLSQFEERMDDFEKNKPKCIIASGIDSIGRMTLLKNCLYKANIKKNAYPFPVISLNSDESIEDFILKIYDLGLTEEKDITNLLHKTVEEKEKFVIELFVKIQQQDEIIFIEDMGGIINHDGEISEWFDHVINNNTLKNKITICLVSKFRHINRNYHDSTYKIFSIEVDELNRKERNGLLSRYAEFENVDLSIEDMNLISDLLTGYPEQVFYVISLIKESGIDYAKRHTELIVEFNFKKASILLKEFEQDTEKMELLALLSSFDYIGTKFLTEIIGYDEKYHDYLNEFISKAICEYVGVMKEYVRVNETVKDYITRSEYKISEKHKNQLSKNLNTFLKNLHMQEYDIPEFLFSLKEAVMQNKEIDEKYIVPSLYLKTMNEFYNKGKNKEVIVFADKALENENFMDAKMIFEIRYLLCSALAKLRDKRFMDEVQKISGADHEFLFGFYYRQIGKYDKALEKINSSMKLRRNFSKAKREKVQIYLGMQEYQSAKELAKENYDAYKDNPYHIQAYFSCLIRSEKNRDNRKILQDLIRALEVINSDVSKEMFLRCQAQFEAFYNDNYEESISKINAAIGMNTSIQYARLIKFEICDRFNELEEMKEIIEFFKQKEYRQRYYNNLICFESIIKAKEGDVQGAIDYYSENIRNYTDEAMSKFIVRLNRYC